MSSMTIVCLVRRFHKLTFFSLRDNGIFASQGHKWKTNECGLVHGMIMSISPKQMYKILRNSYMFHHLDPMLSKRIHYFSLKGLRKRAATRHKMMIVTQINEPYFLKDL